MKTIIAGSRGIDDYSVVKAAIAFSGFEITEVVSGGANGVDKLGERWAKDNGVPITRFIPDWSIGKSAGIRRNEKMARYADCVICIWDGVSPGTKHMMQFAKRLGLKVFVHTHIDAGSSLDEFFQ